MTNNASALAWCSYRRAAGDLARQRGAIHDRRAPEDDYGDGDGGFDVHVNVLQRASDPQSEGRERQIFWLPDRNGRLWPISQPQQS